MAVGFRLSALALILGAALGFPSTIAAASPLELEGTLELVHGEDFVSGAATYDYRLQTRRERVRLEFKGEAPDGFVNGAMVRVRGHRTDPGVVVADGGSSSGTVLLSAPGWSGPRRLAVVLINFKNDRSRPFSRGFANGIVFSNSNSVRAYFAEASGGAMNLTGTTFDWLPLAVSSSTCDPFGWESAGKAGLAARGVDLSTYTNFMFIFPATSSCGWRGLGHLPGPTTWINGVPNLRTPAHELAHNFGVHHATSLRCWANGVRVALSARCTRNEYGDPFTTMGGSGRRHDHALARVQLGYLPAEATRTATASGSYYLAKAFASSGTRVIGIPRGNGTWLYLEYRRPHGKYFDNFSSTSSAVRGVSIRLAKGWSTITQSSLIDTVPSTTTFADAPLRLNRTFRDYLSGITVTVTSLGTGGARVWIQYPADRTPPSTPGGLHATSATESSISIAWSAATDNRGVAGYRIWQDGAQVGTTTASTLSWTGSGLASGTSYAFVVRAVDGAGNLSAAASLTVATATPDLPPSIVELSVTLGNPTWSQLSWTEATDDNGVAAYRVYRDGILYATLDAAARDLRVPAGSTYVVTAVDTAGNEGPPSIDVQG